MSFDLFQYFDQLGTIILDSLKQIGAAAIIVAVSTFISQWISKNHEANIAHKYDEQMERFRTDLDRVKHVQQHQFDNEYAIYQDLSSKFFEMKSAVRWLFPTNLDRAPAWYYNTEELRKICDDRYTSAQESYNDAIRTLGGKAPFINEELYKKFMEIIELCAHQINCYAYANPTVGKSPDVERRRKKGYATTSIIEDKWEALIAELRTYTKDMIKER